MRYCIVIELDNNWSKIEKFKTIYKKKVFQVTFKLGLIFQMNIKSDIQTPWIQSKLNLLNIGLYKGFYSKYIKNPIKHIQNGKK